MTERRVTANSVDTFVSPSRAGVWEAQNRQAQTQRFFQNMGAVVQQGVNHERDEEVAEYQHNEKLKAIGFGASVDAARNTLSKDEYRHMSAEERRELPEAKEVFERLNAVSDKRLKERLALTAEEMFSTVDAEQTHKTKVEHTRSLGYDAMNAVPTESYQSFAEDIAPEIGHAAAYDMMADNVIDHMNIEGVDKLLSLKETKMTEETKRRLVTFKNQYEKALASSKAKASAEEGRLKVHFEKEKDPAIAERILVMLKERGVSEDEGEYGKWLGKLDLATNYQDRMERGREALYRGNSVENVRNKFDLSEADVKRSFTEMWENAYNQAKAGDDSEMLTMLTQNAYQLAPQLKATVNDSFSRFRTLKLDDVGKLKDGDPIFDDLNRLISIGHITNDAALEKALGSKDLEELRLLRLDQKVLGSKGALMTFKQRQEAAMSGNKAPLFNWAAERKEILNATLSDVPDHMKGQVRSILGAKLESLQELNADADSVKRAMADYVERIASFEYDGDTIMFSGKLDTQTQVLQAAGYDVDQEALFGKYHEYVLEAVKKDNPNVEEVKLSTNPLDPSILIAQDPEGQMLLNPVHRVDDLFKAYTDKELTIKEQAAKEVKDGGWFFF